MTDPHALRTAAPAADAPLGELLVAMRTGSAAAREAAWATCYERYHQVVWTRAFYVVRSVAWLAEPREVAAEVASDVFVGLPDAARNYREEGRAEWWLKQITVRAALRRKAALTGQWGRSKTAAGAAAGSAAAGSAPAGAARAHVSFEETADQIVARLDAAEHEELMELGRRRAALRASDDPAKRRWDQFLDFYIAGYDFKEIGERMGMTEGSARNWLVKIRKYLARPVAAAP